MPRPEPEGHVRVGQIVGTFGTKGGLKVVPLTDFIERFEPPSLLYLHGTAHTIERATWHKGQARLQLSDIDSIEAVEAVRWEYLTVPASERPELEEGEYLTRDLVGLTVFERGKPLGVVKDVVNGPAQDLLQIGDALVPCVREFVKKVDLEKKRIDVELIEGMRPGDQAEEVR